MDFVNLRQAQIDPELVEGSSLKAHSVHWNASVSRRELPSEPNEPGGSMAASAETPEIKGLSVFSVLT